MIAGNKALKQVHEASAKVKDIKFGGSNLTLIQLQNYVINFDKYCTQCKERDELNAQLQEKIRLKEEAEASLKATKAKLKELQEFMEKLEEEDRKNRKESNEAQERVKILRERLDTAKSLFTGLKSEETRWSLDKVKLAQNKEKLIGDCMLGAAFLSYCGPFSFDFRKRMIYDTWKADIVNRKINVSEDFTVQKLLTTEQRISQWNIDTLPDDELSIQNGILTENAKRWPLAVDPENQAVSWLKKKSDGLKVLTFNVENYMKNVSTVLRNGGTVIIENVGETIDPNINPV